MRMWRTMLSKRWHILPGLIFSSVLAQKFGSAFAGWAVSALLAFFGYNTAENAVQTPEALDGLVSSELIPAAIAHFPSLSYSSIH